MKKLTLVLDELKVESFETSANPAQNRGTVHARQETANGCGETFGQWTCQQTCWDTCQNTCPNTCEVTCQNAHTCLYLFCDERATYGPEQGCVNSNVTLCHICPD